MPKGSAKEKAAIQAQDFNHLLRELRSKLDKGELPKGIPMRDQRKLGHDCPDKGSERRRLFTLLDDANMYREQYDPKFIVELHAVYMNELYYAGELELPVEVKVAA